MLLLHRFTSPDGGIGRRAGLKHQWGNPCRFDPGSGYEFDSKIIAKALKLKTLAIFYFPIFPTFSPHLQSFLQKFFFTPQIFSSLLIFPHQDHNKHLNHLNFIQSD